MFAQSHIQVAFFTDEIQRNPSTPQDELLSWDNLEKSSKFLRHVDTTLKNIRVSDV